jgi:hypothetical protein
VSAARRRALAQACAILLPAALAFGCVAADGGYYGGPVGYGVGYYEPSGIADTGWGPSYFVAPFRDRGHPYAYRGGGAAPHGFRAAPAGRGIPSIPSTARGGGGGHGGGGGFRR